MKEQQDRFITPFNSPLEIGLRAISILTDAYPSGYSLQRLSIFDYFSVHSDDFLDGPTGLHPKTPHRSGELLVRRELLQKGLRLYMCYGLIEQRFETTGITYAATERTGGFLDALTAGYTAKLRERTAWLVDNFKSASDNELESLVQNNFGVWGIEFEMESILWMEDENE